LGQVTLLALLGAALAAFSALVRWPLHLPGWHGLVIMAFLVGAKRQSRAGWAASLVGVGAWAAAMPLPLHDPFTGSYLLLAGLSLDALTGAGALTLASPVWAWALAGACAWLVHPALAPFVAVADGHVRLLAWGQGYALATHFAFGLMGSALGASLHARPHRSWPWVRFSKGRKERLRTWSWLLVILAPLPWIPWRRARAAQADAATTYALGQIEVTGKAAPKSPAGTHRVVTAREIRQRGARTLDQAIELLPGVNLHEGGKGVPRIDIRGLRTRQVKLLINGVPFNSTYDGQFDPRLIPVNNIARIELIAGPSSVLYGDGGMGGVINIITRKGTRGTHGTAQVEAGSVQYSRETASVSGGNRWGNYWLSLDHAQRNGFPLADSFNPTPVQGSGERDDSDRRSTDLYANFGLDPIPTLHLGLTLTRTTGEHGIPPSTIDNHADPFAQPPHYERIEGLGGHSVQLAGLWSPRGPWRVRSWVYVNAQHLHDNRYDSNSYASISDPHIKNTFLIHRSTRIAGFHIQPSRRLGAWGRLSFAFSGRRAYWRDTGVIRDQAQGGGGGGSGGGSGGGHGGGRQATFGLRTLDESRHVDYGTAAVQWQAHPVARLQTTLGYGWTWQARERAGNEADSIFSAGARYRINRKTSVRADIGRKIQYPNLRQLYDPISGNTNLHAQRADLYELGIRRLLPAASQIRVTGFVSDIHGFIEKNHATDRFDNFNHYMFKGVEVAATSRPNHGRLALTLSYTRLYSHDFSSGKDQLQYRPRQTVGLNAHYRLIHGLSLDTSVRYVGQQVYYSRHRPVQKAHLPSYTLVNLRLAQRLWSNRLTLFVGARNLFDKNYFDSYGFPQAGRVVYGGAKMRF